ncbi:MAG: BLUF domain-containing protein [Henriciella sp.]|uniref:BLUF domain-containing protein n=1 Tax=Henriciella sp. TaxID=1968823 RepID=UPI003C70DE5A
MKRIIYLSSARHNLKPPHIKDILTVSRENNRKADMTGLLVFHDSVFLQVLEGPDEAVSETYARIERDWRHTDCRVLFDEPVVERAFAEWAMAYKIADDLEARQIRQLNDIQTVARTCKAGEYADHPSLDVFLRAFLASFRLLNAA